MKLPLRNSQTVVLMYIQAHPGCTTAQGAEALRIGKPSFRRIAEGQYARGLVLRQPAVLRSIGGFWSPAPSINPSVRGTNSDESDVAHCDVLNAT
jgi:hypothetical protein